MKVLKSLTLVAALLFALTTISFAANKNEGNFTLSDTARVGSTDLQPGQYKAEWSQDNSGAVKVDILQHGKTVASAQGKLKDLQQPAPYDAVVVGSGSDNTKTIDEIDFNKRTQALVFGGE